MPETAIAGDVGAFSLCFRGDFSSFLGRAAGFRQDFEHLACPADGFSRGKNLRYAASARSKPATASALFPKETTRIELRIRDGRMGRAMGSRVTAAFLVPLAFMPRFMKWVVRVLFVDRWREIELESDARSREFDYRPLVILVTSAVVLTLLRFWGNRQTLNALLGIDETGHFARLYGEIAWAICCFLGFFVVPALVLKLMREPVLDYGLRLRGFSKRNRSVGLTTILFIPFILLKKYW